MTLLAGIDVGTSSIKAVITDMDGEVLGAARGATPWRTVGVSTQMDVDTLLEVTEQALIESLRGTDLRGRGRVAGVGITGIAESGVAVDSSGRARSAIVAWQDPHGDAQAEALANELGRTTVEADTGQPLTRRLSAVKLRWLRDSRRLDPDAEVGWRSVPEVIVGQWGGTPAPDRSQWTRTGFLDVVTGGYLAAVADWSGLAWRALPDPVPSGSPLGRIGPDHSIDALRGAVLTTAGHDHVCAAFGAGVSDEATVFDSWGNGEALIRLHLERAGAVVAPGLGCSLGWGLFAGQHVLFRGLGTGIVLSKVLTLLGGRSVDRDGLDREAEALGRNPELPRLAVAADGKVSISYRRGDMGAEHVWRAALEWAFDRVRTGTEALAAIAGPVTEVVGCGGWLSSSPITRLKRAAISGFRAHPAAEPAAIGAALIAGRSLNAT